MLLKRKLAKVEQERDFLKDAAAHSKYRRVVTTTGKLDRRADGLLMIAS